MYMAWPHVYKLTFLTQALTTADYNDVGNCANINTASSSDISLKCYQNISSSFVVHDRGFNFECISRKVKH